MKPIALALLLIIAPLSLAAGPALVLKVPEGLAVKSAVATAPEMKLDTPGAITGPSIRFENLLPDSPYNIALTLDDGTLLQGVNMEWYGMDPKQADAGPISDEDRKEVTTILTDVKAFENKKNMLMMDGDNTRITALVELIRDIEFHASGGNITWRIELWYFKNEFGGWAKVSQQNKVLRRERFKNKAAFDAAVPKIKWVPALGGLRVKKDQAQAEVNLPAEALPAGLTAKTKAK